MRTALTHIRDWSCLIAALAFIFSMTILPQRPVETARGGGGTVAPQRAKTDAASGSYTVASGTVLPESAR